MVLANIKTISVALFNEWQPLLSTYVLRITRSELMAEEVVQEVFLKIWIGRDI